MSREMADRFRAVLEHKIAENHLDLVEDLCTAFIARVGIDPELTRVVSEMTETPDGIKWITYFERRTDG